MRKIAIFLAALSCISLSTIVWSGSTSLAAPDGAFQMRYAANLNIGDSVINMSNAGSSSSQLYPKGNICANVYVLSPDEQLAACCACLITPDALVHLSAQNDLISNTLTGIVPTSIVIKLLATAPNARNTCNPSSPNASNLTAGLVAWGTTLHALPTTPVTYGVTEEEFTSPVLSSIELSNLASQCGFILSNGSGAGVCKSCKLGGL